MLLLDKNNTPTNTVYYIAAVSYGYLLKFPYLSFIQLYDALSEKVYHRQVQFDFFVLAIDFLFLLDKVALNEKGELYVP